MEGKPLASFFRIPVLKGVFLAFGLQALILFLLVNLIHFTGLSDRHLSSFIAAGVFLGVAGGGMAAARSAEARFLLQGLGVGIICFLVVLLFSVFSDAALEMGSVGKRAITFLSAGLLGGLLGALSGK